MLLTMERYHAAVGHFAYHVLELNGGVVNMKAFVQPLLHHLQNAVASRKRQVGYQDVTGERVHL